jgi:hypothetical protein
LKRFFRNLSLFFSAGSLGGLANSFTVWIFGILGIPQILGVQLAPSLTKSWLYPRIIWGGLWGLLFLLPTLRQSHFSRGLLLSLVPTLVQLFIVFPVQNQKGVLGIELGVITPVFVLFYNAVWGVCTSFWLKWVQEDPTPDWISS